MKNPAIAGFNIVNKTYVYSLSLLSALFSLTSSMVAPVTQYITKLTRNIINQKPIVATVRKAKKPKYWENSIFGSFLNSAPNIRRIFIPAKNRKLKNIRNYLANHF